MKDPHVGENTVILIGEHKSIVAQQYPCADCGTMLLKPVNSLGPLSQRCPECKVRVKHERWLRNRVNPQYQKNARRIRHAYKQRHGLNLGTPLSDTHLTKGHVAAYILLKRGMKNDPSGSV